MKNRARGFTLIELMVTVAIIAILAAIALPAYQAQMRKGRRAAAKSAAMDIANREQQYLMINRGYMDLSALSGTGYTLPTEVSGFYTLTLTAAAGPPPTYLITFTPSGVQTVDGALTLDQAGNKTGQW